MKKQPLEFANIVLFSLPDFTFLQGTISDQTGAFNIKSNETKGVLPISSVAIPLFSYLALVQIWEQYNYIQMRNYYTLVHIMLSCEVM